MNYSNIFVDINMDNDLRSVINLTMNLYNCINGIDPITNVEVRRRFADCSDRKHFGLPWVMDILQRFVDFGVSSIKV